MDILTRHLSKTILFFFVFSGLAVAGQTYNPLTNQPDYCLTVTEEDGTPANRQCLDLKVSNGTLTDNGDGTYSLNTSGGTSQWTTAGSNIYYKTGNVSIGTTTATNALQVLGAAAIGTSAYNVTAPLNGLIVEGRVGIGTSNPSQVLDVAGAGAFSGSGDSYFMGNLGIGTSAPPQLLTVNGTVKAQKYQGYGGELTGITYSETDPIVKALSGIIKSNGSTIGTATPGTDYLVTELDPKVGSLTLNYIPKMGAATLGNSTIFDNGNVGIGTTNPPSTSKLEINGSYNSAEIDPSGTNSFTVNWALGNYQYIGLGTGANTITLTNPTPGMRSILVIKQPSSGTAATVTWASSPTAGLIRWKSGTAPTLSTTSGYADVVGFGYVGIGTTAYYGVLDAGYY